jgi:hypothetical protein
MKRLTLLLLLVTPIIIKAQERFPVIVNDTLFISPYDYYWKGCQIKTGAGTLPNGDFKYITTSPSSWVALMSASASDPLRGVMPLKAYASGTILTVKDIKATGNRKRGFKVWLMVGGGNIVNYLVDIEFATGAGEILSNNPKYQKKNESAYSVADEIKKLKELLDAGAITQDEYDAQKKKLLSQ